MEDDVVDPPSVRANDSEAWAATILEGANTILGGRRTTAAVWQKGKKLEEYIVPETEHTHTNKEKMD